MSNNPGSEPNQDLGQNSNRHSNTTPAQGNSNSPQQIVGPGEGGEDESEWETESSENEDSDEDAHHHHHHSHPPHHHHHHYHHHHGFGDDDMPDDDDDDDFTDDEDDGMSNDDPNDDDDGDVDMNMDDMQQFMLGDPDDVVDIEALTPSKRANRRPNIDDDIMSEFSGDEKYEPKQGFTAEDGEGDQDMYDVNGMEEYVMRDVDEFRLTYKIRQLMLKLTKGRRDRERKLRTAPTSTSTSSSPLSLFPGSPPSTSGSLPSGGAYLHRLITRGPDQPQEVEHSPAISFHHLCASSLAVTPSAMGLSDDLFTINLDSIMRCGVLSRMTESSYHERLIAALAMEEGYDDLVSDKVHKPYARPLKTVKATKYLRNSLYKFDQLPPSEAYVPIQDEDDPMCMTHKYGYMAMGGQEGTLIVYCTECDGEPIEIHNDMLSRSLHDVMLNSVQIVRWPRYHRERTLGDDGVMMEQDESSAVDGEEYDEQEGYPTKSGQFDHYLVMTGDRRGLFIAALPDHPDPKADYQYEGDDYEHVFKFKEDNTWIKSGFGGEALNDAKVSPNGRWIAVVGDSNKVWTIEVVHEPESERERKTRLEREHELMMEELETDSDSEYVSDDSSESDGERQDKENAMVLTPNSQTNNHIDQTKLLRGGEKRSRDPDEILSESKDTTFKNAKPTRIPRLLHRFEPPVEMHVPDRVLYPTPPKRDRRQPPPRTRLHHQEEYTSQYVAWNATSTKFAHSSDTCYRVVVWSMPSREIVCCVDTGGLSFALEFHPKLENLFAVANWYGFVHVMDVTGCCVGDEDLVPEDVHYDGKPEQGPSMGGCEGPHYEEKHDILMLSFRGEKDRQLRILDGIRGLGWSTDGRHLYVSTLRRVLRYDVADEQIRIPSLFQLCANKVKEWKERTINRQYTGESERKVRKAFRPMEKQWKYVPYYVKRRIFGDIFLMRSHDE